jgi:hypothetical protein
VILTRTKIATLAFIGSIQHAGSLCTSLAFLVLLSSSAHMNICLNFLFTYFCFCFFDVQALLWRRALVTSGLAPAARPQVWGRRGFMGNLQASVRNGVLGGDSYLDTGTI